MYHIIRVKVSSTSMHWERCLAPAKYESSEDALLRMRQWPSAHGDLVETNLAVVVLRAARHYSLYTLVTGRGFHSKLSNNKYLSSKYYNVISTDSIRGSLNHRNVLSIHSHLAAKFIKLHTFKMPYTSNSFFFSNRIRYQ